MSRYTSWVSGDISTLADHVMRFSSASMASVSAPEKLFYFPRGKNEWVRQTTTQVRTEEACIPSWPWSARWPSGSTHALHWRCPADGTTKTLPCRRRDREFRAAALATCPCRFAPCRAGLSGCRGRGLPGSTGVGTRAAGGSRCRKERLVLLECFPWRAVLQMM